MYKLSRKKITLLYPIELKETYSILFVGSVSLFLLTVKGHDVQIHHSRLKTAARKSAIGGLYICTGGFIFCKIEKKSTDLYCFILKFGVAWSFVFGRLNPQNPPHGNWTVQTASVNTFGTGPRIYTFTRERHATVTRQRTVDIQGVSQLLKQSDWAQIQDFK